MALTLNDGGNNEAAGGFGLVWMMIVLMIEGGGMLAREVKWGIKV